MRASARGLALASLSLGLAAAAFAQSQQDSMSQPSQPPVQPFGGLTPPGISTNTAGSQNSASGAGFSTAPVASAASSTAPVATPGTTTPTGAPGTVPTPGGPQFQNPPGPQYQQQQGPAFTQPAAPFTPVTPSGTGAPVVPQGTVNPGPPGSTTAPKAPEASLKQQRRALQAEFNRRRTELTLSDEFKNASRKERKAQLEALKREFLEKERDLARSGK